MLLDDDEINRKVKAKVSGSDLPLNGDSNLSHKSNQKKGKLKRKLKTQNNENCSEDDDSKSAEFFDDDSLCKRLKLEQDESSNTSNTEGFVDIVGDAGETLEHSNASSYSNGKALENSRSTSPIFDFLGEKIGPKRPKRGTGGKRGRPPTSNKSSPLRGAANSSGDEGNLNSKLQGKGPGRPRTFKIINGPMNQGDRWHQVSSPHKQVQQKSIAKLTSRSSFLGDKQHLSFKKVLSQSSSSQSSLNPSPSLTPSYINMSPQPTHNAGHDNT